MSGSELLMRLPRNACWLLKRLSIVRDVPMPGGLLVSVWGLSWCGCPLLMGVSFSGMPLLSGVPTTGPLLWMLTARRSG